MDLANVFHWQDSLGWKFKIEHFIDIFLSHAILENMQKKNIRIRVIGRVQGVNFRQTCKTLATRYGVTGYAENKSDGSVEIVARGSEDQLHQFIVWMQRGSTFSRIDSFQYETIEDETEYENFSIKRSGNMIEDQLHAFETLGKRVLNRVSKKIHEPNPNDYEIMPGHIVIIPDGNRRWAKERGLPAWKGHIAGIERTKELSDFVKKLNIKYITLWGFSTENWKRDDEEVHMLMEQFISYIRSEKESFVENGIVFKHLGRKDRLSAELLNALEDMETATANGTGMHVNVALDYGGRDELMRCMDVLHKNGCEVTEEAVSDALDTNGIPDPDLIIRTGGEQRLSGIMPWQSAYAELYFAPVYFPDFTVAELDAALKDYAMRHRRYGA